MYLINQLNKKIDYVIQRAKIIDSYVKIKANSFLSLQFSPHWYKIPSQFKNNEFKNIESI